MFLIMDLNNLGKICEENSLVLVDSSILSYAPITLTKVEYSKRHKFFYHMDYSRSMCDFIFNNKNIVTTKEVVGEIKNGLDNYFPSKQRNVCSDYMENHKSNTFFISQILKRRVLGQHENFGPNLEFIKRFMGTTKISGADANFIAHLLTCSQGGDYTAGLSNDVGLLYVATKAKKCRNINSPLSLYYFDGEGFTNAENLELIKNI